ncbi:MAG: phosphopantetheine-binding protein [Amoebophilaceae bacterium]|jgi:acyl carrier protein|nr:phosphopantetheine-binding protein [Amoebophilaceae bacterium]
MERQEILNVIKGNLAAAVDGILVDQIDPQKAMNEYGASSLDVVEVVSNSMRQLKVKIPRTELGHIKNIDGLADTFYRYANNEGVA